MASFKATITSSGERFDAPGDQTLLASALEAGLALPSSCRNGTCRTCMRRLSSGSVAYRIEWPGLTPEEKEDGWVLPCVAYPASDVTLDGPALRPWWETGSTRAG